MALKLNLPDEYIRIDGLEIPFYKEFCGTNTEQMPKLIANGRIPMNVAQLMQRKLDAKNSDLDVKHSYLDNHFYMGDAVVYHPEGDVLIDLDSQRLREITPEDRLNAGALLLSIDRDEAFAIYEQLKKQSNVIEFKKGKLGKVDKLLLRESVKSHPVWKVLARDQGLLNNYADYIFAEGKQRFGYDTAMGIFPSSAHRNDAPEMRAWCVSWLEDRSNAIGWVSLDYDYGRFVGIAPEEAGKYTGADVSRASFELGRLESVINPKAVSNIRSLLMKLQ